jgi:hypothetical protein
MRYFVAVFGGAFCGLVIAWMSGCTAAQQATAASATVTSAKIAACVQGVLAEEEAARLRAIREEERLAEERAAEIAEAAREHSPSVKEEIEKVIRDGGTKE